MKIEASHTLFLIWVILFFQGGIISFAQQSNTFYLMHDVPQSNLLNPAVQIKCKYYVGIPILTSSHVSYSNTAFTYEDIAGNGSWDLEGALNQMHRSDLYLGETMLVPVSLGYRHKSLYFTFNLSERIQGFQTVPKDLAEMAIRGNGPFVGETAKFDGFRPGGHHTREYSLGVSKVLGPYLTAGIRAKLLFGKSNITTGTSNLAVSTAEDNFGLLMNVDYTLNTSFPYTLTYDDNGDINGIVIDDIDPVQYLLNRKNVGFALDMGLVYRYDDKITLSASLLDVGLVRWRTELNNIRGNGVYEYTGIDLSADLVSFDFIEEALDSILNSIDVTTTQDPYSYFLPTQLFLAGSYQYSEKISFGLVNRNVLYRNKLHSSFTALSKADLAGRFTGTLSWSYLNNSIKNIGVGLAYHGKGFQAHAVTENVLGFFYPFNTRTLNLRVGMNLMLGCPRNKRERLQEAAFGNLPAGGACPYPENPNKKWKKRERSARKRNR